MALLFSNNATTTLASGIASGATSLTVSAGAGALFPSISGSNTFFITLANVSGTVEIVLVTATATDTFTIVRGQDGTTARAWNAGDKVELRPTAGVLKNMTQQTATTGSSILPSGTTAQRDSSPSAGFFRFNQDTTSAEIYNGTAWGSVGGGATGAGGDQVFYCNGQTVNTSYSIPSGQNAMSAGPVTVANGITVTIPNGSTYTVV